MPTGGGSPTQKIVERTEEVDPDIDAIKAQMRAELEAKMKTDIRCVRQRAWVGGQGASFQDPKRTSNQWGRMRVRGAGRVCTVG